jgi:hypothetical protein
LAEQNMIGTYFMNLSVSCTYFSHCTHARTHARTHRRRVWNVQTVREVRCTSGPPHGSAEACTFCLLSFD